MTLRPYAALAACVLALGLAAPAQALPPTTRMVDDPVEPGKGYDITGLTLRAAPGAGRPAVVKVAHGRPVANGDVLDVWFDLDGDKVPDVHLTGYAFSEYAVRVAKSFTKDGRDISDQDCVRLSMGGRTSKVKLFPECLGSPVSFAVSVLSYADGGPAAADDWAPGTQRFTKKVLAAPLS